jgi:hypothetical protein
MSLTVNRTEEKESNWADLIDGLRYGGFRRSVSVRDPMAESPASGDAQGTTPVAGTKRKPTDHEPS